MYDTGFQAYERGNYEYAIEMFKRIVAIEPEHVKARKALRATEKKCIGNAKPGFGSSIKAVGVQIKAGIKLVGKKYKEAMEMCEDFLVGDPRNKSVLMLLASAAVKGGFPETAILTLEDLSTNSPKDKKILRQLAKAYEQKDDYENAIGTWRRLQKIDPSDNEAKDTISSLGARQSLTNTWDKKDATAEDFSEKLKSSKDAERAKMRDRIIRTEDERDEAIDLAKEDLEKNPRDLVSIMRIGDLLRGKKDIKGAREYYKKALEVDPNYFDARIKLGDIEISQRTRLVERVKTSLMTKPEDLELRKQYSEARKSQLVFEIKEFESRSKQHPTDMSLRFRLGELYFDGGLLDKAIGAFQKSRKDPKFKNQSLGALGRCFIKRKEFTAAVAPLTEVVDVMTIMNDGKKEVLYCRGQAYEGMGDWEKARADYMAIYLEDIEYKDVAEKIKTLDQN